MSLTVSSWFIEQTRAQRSQPQRRFTITGSDYSAYVLRWPSLRTRSGTVELGTTSLLLSNVARAFDFFLQDDLAINRSCAIALGFTHPNSGLETIGLYEGTPTHVALSKSGTELRLQLQGKTRQLSDVSLGTAAGSEGLDFTNSSHLPSDLVWTLVTCYGGLSNLSSDSNPDLNYGEWLAWRNSDGIRDLRVRGYFTGERIIQVVDTLAVMDSRIVTFQDGQLRFHDKFPAFGTEYEPYLADWIINANLDLDPSRLINHFFVEAEYNPATSQFGASFTKVHSVSRLDFGQRSARFSARGVWFASANDARYLAYDTVYFNNRPQPRVTVQAPLAGGMHLTVGDVISLTYSGFGLAERVFRISQQQIDLERGEVSLTFDEALHRPWQYVANVASDNLLARSITPIGSDTFVALSETWGDKHLFRTDSSGFFMPTSVYASSLLVLNANEVVCGGLPWPVSAKPLMQRSSDGGLTAVTVASLNVTNGEVVDLLQVRSGTLLASVTSGGIYRSTDAGSSWGLTYTISGGYQVQRFFAPESGTVWGATGNSTYLGDYGLYIWASTDDGANWALRHKVLSSEYFRTTGLYRTSDGETLLGHQGAGSDQRGILRSTTTSPDSLSWTQVGSQLSFAEVLKTSSGHLIFGFDENLTPVGGAVYRSLDQGSSWVEDARLTKRGNLHLVDNGQGGLDAFSTRMTGTPRGDRFRNYKPNRIN